VILVLLGLALDWQRLRLAGRFWLSGIAFFFLR